MPQEVLPQEVLPQEVLPQEVLPQEVLPQEVLIGPFRGEMQVANSLKVWKTPIHKRFRTARNRSSGSMGGLRS